MLPGNSFPFITPIIIHLSREAQLHVYLFPRRVSPSVVFSPPSSVASRVIAQFCWSLKQTVASRRLHGHIRPPQFFPRRRIKFSKLKRERVRVGGRQAHLRITQLHVHYAHLNNYLRPRTPDLLPLVVYRSLVLFTPPKSSRPALYQLHSLVLTPFFLFFFFNFYFSI